LQHAIAFCYILCYNLIVMATPNIPKNFGFTPVEGSRFFDSLKDQDEMIIATRSLQERLTNDALVDELTRLPNRRALTLKTNELIKQTIDMGIPFVAVMMDLNGFKHINDTFGHEQGDQVLAGLGVQFRKGNDMIDMTGRLGGDEFLGLLPLVHKPKPGETTPQPLTRDEIEPAVNVIAHRFITSVSDYAKSSGNPVGTSIGWAVCMPDSMLLPGEQQLNTQPELWHQADIMMYDNKPNGRR